MLPALAAVGVARAADPTPADLALAVDAVWVLVAGVLVIFMQAGFALLEAGLTRTKNAGHVAAKNLIVLAVASLAFWAVGFAVAFGTGTPLFGTSGFFLAASTVPLGATYLFQVAFCAVSLAIVWGGMAERTRLAVYPLFGLAYATVIYPVVAHWIWGGGWGCRISPARRSSISRAAPPPLSAPCFWVRGWASTTPMAPPTRFRGTTWPSPSWGCLSSGWAGSASTPARRWRRSAASSPTSP